MARGCERCGQPIAVPTGYTRSKIRCESCGAIVDVPADAPPLTAPPNVFERSTTTPESGPARPTPQPLTQRQPTASTLLTGTTDEEDGQPYSVPGDETVPCPQCARALPLGAERCRHCEYNLVTGTPAVRTFERVHREWEAGWPTNVRFAVMLVLLGVSVLTLLLSLTVGGYGWVSVIGFFWIVAMQAFLVGTYDRLTITRDPRGRVKIMKTWRVCFQLQKPKTIKWREHDGVIVGVTYDMDIIGWMVGVLLLVPFVIPAVLWWWFVLRPERHHAALTVQHGSIETMLYQGLNADQAAEIARCVHELTGLPYHS